MRTLVIGASTNPERYSFKAIEMLTEYNHDVLAYGLREGKVANTPIDTTLVAYENIDTITLYVNPTRQFELYDYIISLHPRRVIFNPGTENDELVSLLDQNNIKSEIACTLVLLRTNQY